MTKKFIFLSVLCSCLGIQPSAFAIPNYGIKVQTIASIPVEKTKEVPWNRKRRPFTRLEPVACEGEKRVKALTLYFKSQSITLGELCSVILDVKNTYNPDEPILVLRKKWEKDFDLFNTHQANGTQPRVYWEGKGELSTWGKVFNIYYPHSHANPKCYARQRIAHSLNGTVENLSVHEQKAHVTFNQFE